MAVRQEIEMDLDTTLVEAITYHHLLGRTNEDGPFRPQSQFEWTSLKSDCKSLL